MATQPFQQISNGGGRNHSAMKGKRPYKSNVTNKIKSSHAPKAASTGDASSDDDESESSAIEEHPTSDGDADVYALSNGQQQAVAGAERRSAGPRSKNDDMMMSDDDERYADVEDIEDSEVSGDEGDIKESRVRRSIENDLIGEFERAERAGQRTEANDMAIAVSDMALDDEARDIALAQQLSLQDANPHIDFKFEVNMNDDPFVGLAEDDTIYKAMWDEAEMAMWRRPGAQGNGRERATATNGTQKRVRFEEVNDTFSRASSPESSDGENDAFPDLFASQDDPAIQRHLALDVDDDNGLLPYDWADTESCYDFDGEEENLAFQLDEEDDSDGSNNDSDLSDCKTGALHTFCTYTNSM